VIQQSAPPAAGVSGAVARLPALVRDPTGASGRFQWYFAVQFVALSGFATFRTAYLQDLGLSGTAIGTVGFLFVTAGLLAQPVWGAVADRTGARRRVLAVGAAITALAVLSYPASAGVADPFGLVAVGTVVLAAGRAPLTPVANAMVLAAGLEYGRVRAFGSLAFGVGALALGGAVAAVGTRAVAYVYAAGMGLAGVVALSLPDGAPSRERGGARALLANRPFLVLVVVAFLLGASMRAGSSFLAVYVRATGGSDALTGIAWALKTAFEAAVFLAADRLGRSERTLLLVGGGFLTATSAVYAVVPTPGVAVVVGAQGFNGLGYALVTVAAVGLAGRLAGTAGGATAQSALAAAGFGAGGAVGQPIAGWVLDAAGARAIYLVFTVVAAVGTVVALGVRKQS